MANSDLPPEHSSGHSDDGSASSAGSRHRSRLEEALVKSSIWKKQTLRDIEKRRAEAARESSDRDAQTAHLLNRLSVQLVERNEEIERLRRAVTRLENEVSRLDHAHQRELDERRAELQQLQDAYDEFEKESDSLLSELSEQNERLRDECRDQNARSLLK